jgi:hypothetical protein
VAVLIGPQSFSEVEDFAVAYESMRRGSTALELQEIRSQGRIRGSGLRYVPVEHRGNQISSPPLIGWCIAPRSSPSTATATASKKAQEAGAAKAAQRAARREKR